MIDKFASDTSPAESGIKDIDLILLEIIETRLAEDLIGRSFCFISKTLINTLVAELKTLTRII